MSKKYGFTEEELKLVWDRDKKTGCVYCKKKMVLPKDSVERQNWATIEHLYPPSNNPTWICYCCNGCNLRHKKPLREWFKTDYCKNRGINENTVADPIKRFLKSGLKEYYMLWLDGPEHNFIASNIWEPVAHQNGVQFVDKSKLSDKDRKHFEKIVEEIRHHEFVKWYKDRDPKISRYYGHEYWLKANLMYRRPATD